MSCQASSAKGRGVVPLVDVTCADTVPEEALRRLAQLLPDIVAEAVACPEEPWTGPPLPGDIEIRFRARGRFDVGELDCVVEVRTKLLPGRLHDKDQRAERIRCGIVEAEPRLGQLGVWLILHEGSWAQ
jgi:hypothetical protein